MRFIVVPNFPLPYDQRMVRGLAAGFRQIGHEAIALNAPLPTEVLVDLAKRTDANVVIQVNRFRPVDPPLPSAIRHIAWLQDIFPDNGDMIPLSERGGDIVYALGDARALGLKVDVPCLVGSLVTGVEPALLERRSSAVNKADFSLCGYIPPPWLFKPNIKSDIVWYLNDAVDRVPIIGRSWVIRHLRFWLLRRFIHRNYIPFALATTLREIVTALYRPLSGDLDIHLLSEALRLAAQPYTTLCHKKVDNTKPFRRGRFGRILAPYRAAGSTSAIETMINQLAREYPRLLDRVALVNAALEVSCSLELYGPGWDTHEAFSKYHKGIINDSEALISVYRSSRINLANNTHGLGLHSRTLECMAVGGFVFMHRSPNDEKPGGMLTEFEPSVHYGAYTPDSFAEEAKRWLRDEPERAKAGQRAASVIKGRHMWHHRAGQILADLKK